MSRFNIGIDTGGTYTDAVIVDLHGKAIVAAAKAETTHGDLSIGVTRALSRVLDVAGDAVRHADVSLVSVSTTLATNALVEGRGAAVASVLVGFDDDMTTRSRIAETLPAERIVRIAGGHDYAGQEIGPLDEAALRTAAGRLAGDVSAFAVASLYSVRNASHEHRAQQIIREATGLPVSLSCDLSSALDGPRRALTATLNARIISRIDALVAAIRRSLEGEGITARLMFVRGDGSLVPVETVVERPIETIMSGPAASVIGARFLSGHENFVVADIGGTTTDIAIAQDGWPDISRNGSTIGNYRTMVQAIDMQTAGLGGDSEVLADSRGGLALSTRRVVPLALLGARWPGVRDHLRGALDAGHGLRTACRFLLLPEGTTAGDIDRVADEEDRAFLAALVEGARPWAAMVRRRRDEHRVERLVTAGLLQLGGPTPSDAAHALGQQDQWCAETARLGCEVLGRLGGSITAPGSASDAGIRAVAARIAEAVVAASAQLVLRHLAGIPLADDDPLLAAVAAGQAAVGRLGVALAPRVPLVAVGGPAALYYPEVGRRLGCAAVVPAHAATANAVGAAVGMIRTQVSIEVTSDRGGAWLVHADDAPLAVSLPGEALATARSLAVSRAEAAAQAAGANGTETDVTVERVDIPDTLDDLGLVSATVTAVCTGRLAR